MVQTFTSENFQEKVLQSKLPVLVDFWATWCGPCQMMGPVLEELSTNLEGKVVIGKLNVDENQEIAQNYQVMSIPNLILFKNGQIVDQVIGLQDKEALRQKIEAAI